MIVTSLGWKITAYPKQFDGALVCAMRAQWFDQFDFEFTFTLPQLLVLVSEFTGLLAELKRLEEKAKGAREC